MGFSGHDPAPRARYVPRTAGRYVVRVVCADFLALCRLDGEAEDPRLAWGAFVCRAFGGVAVSRARLSRRQGRAASFRDCRFCRAFDSRSVGVLRQGDGKSHPVSGALPSLLHSACDFSRRCDCSLAAPCEFDGVCRCARRWRGHSPAGYDGRRGGRLVLHRRGRSLQRAPLAFCAYGAYGGLCVLYAADVASPRDSVCGVCAYRDTWQRDENSHDRACRQLCVL